MFHYAHSFCDGVATCVGYAFIGYVVIALIRWIQVNFFCNVKLKKKYNASGNNWAVVTGASEGIGRAMAIELATRGMNVIGIARSKDKLDEVTQRITREQKVQAKAISLDFSTAGDVQYAALFAELDKVTVSVLVNNVGIMYEHPEEYDQVDIAMDMRMLKINCETQLRMTKYVLPKMKARRSGAIVDLSSTICRVGGPLLSTYCGTKAFNAHFSTSLAVEVAEFGIDVLTVYPMAVCSQMSGRKHPTFDCPDPRAVAAHTLTKLGSVSHTCGHVNHAFVWSLTSWIPTCLLDGIALSYSKKLKRETAQKNSSSR